MILTLADAARCFGALAEEGYDKTVINSVQTDSRTVTKDDLFVCISGDNYDGHEFAAQAAKSGAAAIIASRMLDDVDAPVIMVRDTLKALGKLAACWRDMCGARLVAVTGTAGKTTVKEMLYAVCSQKFSVAKNYRNFNNQIGLPMSMLKATDEQELWIMELGISHQGDMEELAPVASPDIAVITNVGPGHLEGLGDEAGVAQAKTVLLKYLRQSGSAIISRDYPLLWDAAREIVDAPTAFSTQGHRDTSYVASFLGGAEVEGWGRFDLRTPEGEGELIAPFCGEHYAENLACVAAVAHELGLSREDVINGLKTLEADTQRFCCKVGGDVTVIDDTYNANPLSMRRSIATARELAGDTPLVLVLADMRELGRETVMRHEELGTIIREAAPSAVFYKGDHRQDVAKGYGGDITQLTTPDEFITRWNELGIDRGVVLVKGSRSLKMEEYANILCRKVKAGMQGDNQ
ncbi:UDP-N-acetylmuramoyl-tripeptide--D-alanyl-D-alanine ligase [Pseudodesulfovibrio sediminis]|uniref:UDP-N-acetylmuramoyl-tripeptide--D-alanyl-D-alanine ligase n=1 Tax=Pseudodesulfovibrio sediminis TaxID=2810563 RepID=A0ABN6ESC7_9BACT|nr:UDP-N-acetylmuramoyl-tripeptide--D-alanyl-D-alanine ligase [Pseudodesulfovibrio sediminis]BCS88350.1 UDP-N-acetylmuramoyl-tripeptide--D-alanyl-D-alanine ligase [Pseudodesulfovibrio sediminis]